MPSGFLPGGVGPGGVLPAGNAAGELLMWDGTAWVPVADPSAVVPGGSALLLWDEANQVWTPLEGNSSGEVLVWDGTGWVLSSGFFSTIYTFGNWTVSATTPSWLEPWEGQGASQTTEINSSPLVATRNLTFRRAYVRHNTPAGAIDLTYTVEIDGVLSALTATLNSGANGPATDLVNTVNINAGQRFAVRVTHPAGGPFACRAQFQFEAVQR